MELEDTFQKTFTIYPKHLSFLQQINDDNTSLALRTVLDSIINGKEQTERKKILDNTISISSYGVIILLLSYLIPIAYRVFIILIGISIFAYGISGGVQLALRRTRNNR